MNNKPLTLTFVALLLYITISGLMAQTNGGSGGTLPATCVTNSFFIKSGSSPGPYYCSATDTWTAASGQSPNWVLVANQVPAGAVNYDFPNLGSYSEILVLVRNLTTSAGENNILLVSTDNGSTFLNTSGDYVIIQPTGLEANATDLRMYSQGTTTARSGYGHIYGFNVSGAPKPYRGPMSLASDAFLTRYVATTTPLNAIRVRTADGSATITGGNIYVYGRP